MQEERSNGGSPVDVPGYEILDEIGRGGFSVVYLARQPRLNRAVAVKVLTHIDPHDTDSLRRFQDECKAIGSLSWHPHVVTVYDEGRTGDGRPFLAMEHLPSGSLHAQLQGHGAAPWSEAVRVGVQMADALAAAHAAGILHRDLKPANVLIDRLGEYRLADFGIARFAEVDRTDTGVLTGTVAYTAPDVLNGARHSVRADLYSLGALLHCLVTGRSPFVNDDDESMIAIMYRVATQPAPDLTPHGVPPALADLVDQLMAKDPAARPASAIEVGRRLQEVQASSGQPVTPLRSGVGARSAGPPVSAAQVAGRRDPPVPPRPEPPSAMRLAPVAAGPSSPSPPAPATTRPRRNRVPVVVAAVVVGVALAVLAALVAANRDDPSDAATDTTATSPPSSEGCDANLSGDDALPALNGLVVEDRPAAASLIDSWAPQIGAQTRGSTSTYADILRVHCGLRRTFADEDVVLVPSSDYDGAFARPDAWVSIVARPFDTAAESNRWCDGHELDGDECFAKRLARSGDWRDNYQPRE